MKLSYPAGLYLLLCSSSLAAQSSSSTESLCRAYMWSEPKVVASTDSAAQDMTDKWLVPDESGDVYVLGRGANIVVDDTLLRVDKSFVAYKILDNGLIETIPAPPYYANFALPRGVVVNDTLHLLWGEDDTVSVLQMQKQSSYQAHFHNVKRVWMANFSSGQWSEPISVASQFQINLLLSWGIARFDWSPNASFALPGIALTGPQVYQTTFLTARGDSILPALSVGAPFLYTSLVSPAPDHLVLGYIAPDMTVENDRNSIFAVRSADNGLTWGKPVRIALSGLQRGRDISLVQSPNGSLHTFWLRDMKGETFGGQTIGYSISQDTGRTWSEPEYWNAKESMLNFKVIIDSQNTVHIVAQSLLPDNTWPILKHFYRRADDSMWSEPKPIFNDTVSTRMPELIKTETGKILLVFGLRMSKDGPFGQFQTAYSTLVSRRACIDNL